MPPLAAAVLSLPMLPRMAIRRVLGLAGPGLLVSVGYMDPGNWATDLAGGAHYGYALLSVVLIASLLGILLQLIATRVAVGTGQDLAQLIHARFPRPAAYLLWACIEIAMVATDLAELVGGTIGLKLLFGIPELAGLAITAGLTLALLAIPGREGRGQERVVLGLVAAVIVCFAIELVLLEPPLVPVLAGLVPSTAIVRDPTMLYLALGIVGATVMPHNLFLHTGLVAERVRTSGRIGDRKAFRAFGLDTAIALSIAFLVNGAILVVGAALPGDAPGLEEAHGLLSAAVPLAGLLFAIALVAAGQSSTLTGSIAGQLVTSAFLGRTIPRWVRAVAIRTAALVPAAIAILWYGPEASGELLVASQVVLSLALPVVLVPLVLFAAHRGLMGAMALSRAGAAGLWVVALGLGGLNLFLLTTL